MNADTPGVIAVFPEPRPRIKYPWKKLGLNECFLTHIDNRNRVDVQANYHKQTFPDRTFTTVVLPDDPNMLAVFRTK
jgi:hypothetical protein